MLVLLRTAACSNWKMAFYEQERDWWSPPTKLGVPKIFDLISDPKEEYGATLTPNAWVGGPMMKIVAEFEQSLKRYPPIAPGTPDPYTPPPVRSDRVVAAPAWSSKVAMSGLDIFTWIVLVIVIACVIALFLVVGWLPGHVARLRHHPWAKGSVSHFLLQQPHF
jgi:hypothetical protein